MATGDVPSRIATLEYRMAVLENLLAPQLAEAAAVQAKAAEAGVAANIKAEAEQRSAEDAAAKKLAEAAEVAQSKEAQDFLQKLLAQAQAGQKVP